MSWESPASPSWSFLGAAFRRYIVNGGVGRSVHVFELATKNERRRIGGFRMPGPVVAHCGRRIDDSGTKPPAFPLANVNLVAQRLRGLLAELRPAAVVSSAANGADLLLLLVAGELKVPQHVIL